MMWIFIWKREGIIVVAHRYSRALVLIEEKAGVTVTRSPDFGYLTHDREFEYSERVDICG